jgi:hypothetical protein
MYAIDRRPLERLLRAARASYLAGDSWRTIGCALGISRQAAQHRFGECGVAESG